MFIEQKTILIVNYTNVNDINLPILLHRLGYSVLTSSNNPDSLKILIGLRPDLVLLDTASSGADASLYLEGITRDEGLKKTPVVIMGEKTEAEALEGCLKKGAAAFVLKPISPTPLYQIIQRLTERKPRENVRTRIIFKVTVESRSSRKTAYATMLSEKGIFIRTTKPFITGTKVRLSMDLPSEKPVEAEGDVIYTVDPGKGLFIEPGMGVRFTTIDRKTQIGLRKFIEDHLTYDLDPNLEL